MMLPILGPAYSVTAKIYAVTVLKTDLSIANIMDISPLFGTQAQSCTEAFIRLLRGHDMNSPSVHPPSVDFLPACPVGPCPALSGSTRRIAPRHRRDRLCGARTASAVASLRAFARRGFCPGVAGRWTKTAGVAGARFSKCRNLTDDFPRSGHQNTCCAEASIFALRTGCRLRRVMMSALRPRMRAAASFTFISSYSPSDPSG